VGACCGIQVARPSVIRREKEAEHRTIVMS